METKKTAESGAWRTRRWDCVVDMHKSRPYQPQTSGIISSKLEENYLCVVYFIYPVPCLTVLGSH